MGERAGSATTTCICVNYLLLSVSQLSCFADSYIPVLSSMNFVLGWVGITDMETQTEERTHLQQILYLSAIILGYPKNFPSPYERVTMHSLEAPKANVFFRCCCCCCCCCCCFFKGTLHSQYTITRDNNMFMYRGIPLFKNTHKKFIVLSTEVSSGVWKI